VGVSVMLTMLVVTSTAARSRLAEYISPYSAALRSAQQSGAFDSTTTHGIAILEREVERQALLAGYNADFLFLSVAALSALPLLLLIGRPAQPTAEDREQSEMLLAE
jgi:DHA2 family multidrug resistance protein